MVLDAIMSVRTSVVETQAVCQNVWRDALAQGYKDVRTTLVLQWGKDYG